MRRRARITSRRDCGDGQHRVVSLASKGPFIHRRQPCEHCPWRSDLPPGTFPAQAYRHSANTAADAAFSTFACHMSGSRQPAVCAGFLLRNAEHNLGVRLAVNTGRYDPAGVSDGGFPLYDSYRAMAIANGVAADDPALAQCRGNHDNDISRFRREPV